LTTELVLIIPGIGDLVVHNELVLVVNAALQVVTGYMLLALG